MHEKGLQRQIGVGPLVISQERRAAVVLRLSRGYTGCEPDVLFLHRFLCDFVCSCFRKVIQNNSLRCHGGQGERLVTWADRPVSVHSCSVSPRPAPLHRRALRRLDPPMVRSGFRLDRYYSYNVCSIFIELEKAWPSTGNDLTHNMVA